MSASSLPPYRPFWSEVGIPSICTSATSSSLSLDAEMVALPKTISPPQRPLKSGLRFGLAKFPAATSSGEISSAIDVKIIGASAVPSAIILAPLATTSAVAFTPVPASPLMIVPGQIVKVAPASTDTLLPNT